MSRRAHGCQTIGAFPHGCQTIGAFPHGRSIPQNTPAILCHTPGPRITHLLDQVETAPATGHPQSCLCSSDGSSGLNHQLLVQEPAWISCSQAGSCTSNLATHSNVEGDFDLFVKLSRPRALGVRRVGQRIAQRVAAHTNFS